MKTIGFCGGGRIARIFLGGWARAKAMPGRIVVSDSDATALERLKQAHPSVETVHNGNAAAASCDIVFVAVHPPALKSLLAEIAPALTPNAIAVSLAPKFTIAGMTAMLGGFNRIARIIPNAPSIVGAGYNPTAFGAALSQADRAEITALLKPLGASPEVEERLLEAYALVTGMGPTYLWFQMYALAALAESFGIAPDAVREAVASMLEGAACAIEESGMTGAEIMDLIPVKPLADMEEAITQAYKTTLPALFDKIKP